MEEDGFTLLETSLEKNERINYVIRKAVHRKNLDIRQVIVILLPRRRRSPEIIMFNNSLEQESTASNTWKCFWNPTITVKSLEGILSTGMDADWTLIITVVALFYLFIYFLQGAKHGVLNTVLNKGRQVGVDHSIKSYPEITP